MEGRHPGCQGRRDRAWRARELRPGRRCGLDVRSQRRVGGDRVSLSVNVKTLSAEESMAEGVYLNV
jgi:hypothetical protein